MLEFRLLRCEQSDYVSHQENSKCIYEYCDGGNVILLTIRFLDAAKFTILIPLSLLILYKLLLPIVVLIISSLPTFALKSPNRIFVWYFGNWSSTGSSHLLYHHFYPQLMHAHSEQYHTNNLLMLYTISCH